MTITVLSLRWLAEQPFIGSSNQKFEIVLESDVDASGSLGLWPHTYHFEGGWNSYSIKAGETRSFTGNVKVPAEPGTWTLNLHLSGAPGQSIYFKETLGCVIIQNPAALNPEGPPPLLEPGSQIPLPVSPYSPYLEVVSLTLPQLSRDEETEGALVIKLIAPDDHLVWKHAGEVGKASRTERRYGLSNIYAVEAESYTYHFSVSPAGEAYKVLRKGDTSGEYGLKLVFPPCLEDVVPITIRGKLRVNRTTYVLFWGKDERNQLLEPKLATVSVPKPFDGLTEDDLTSIKRLLSVCDDKDLSQSQCIDLATGAMSRIYPEGSQGSKAIKQKVIEHYEGIEPLPKGDYQLTKGWNLIGWTFNDKLVDSRLFDEIPPLESVTAYKEGEGVKGWTNLTKGWPDEANTLKRLEYGRGYWLKLSEEFTWYVNEPAPDPEPTDEEVSIGIYYAFFIDAWGNENIGWKENWQEWCRGLVDYELPYLNRATGRTFRIKYVEPLLFSYPRKEEETSIFDYLRNQTDYMNAQLREDYADVAVIFYNETAPGSHNIRYQECAMGNFVFCRGENLSVVHRGHDDPNARFIGEDSFKHKFGHVCGLGECDGAHRPCLMTPGIKWESRQQWEQYDGWYLCLTHAQQFAKVWDGQVPYRIQEARKRKHLEY